MPSFPITSTAASSRLLKKLKNCCIYSSLLILSTSLTAVEDAPTPPDGSEDTRNSETSPVQAPPPLPADDTVESDDSRNLPQPEVTIIHKKEATIEEYRINGQLRYVKVIPKKGKPYYLVDKDGDGQLETRHSDLDGIPPINQWILMEW